MARFTLILLLLVAVCLSGCPRRSFLEPNKLPPEKIRSALVRTPSPIYREGKDLIVIKTIDGLEPTFHESKAIVSPGRHRFQVGIELHRDDAKAPERGYITRVDTTLEFEVEASKEYLIDAREDENGLWVWATDVETEYVVAGSPPRELPESERIEPMWKSSAP